MAGEANAVVRVGRSFPLQAVRVVAYRTIGRVSVMGEAVVRPLAHATGEKGENRKKDQAGRASHVAASMRVAGSGVKLNASSCHLIVVLYGECLSP